MVNEKIFLEILNSREERAQKQEELLKRYPYSLISFTLNTPGEIKDSKLYRRIHKEGIKAIVEELEIHNIKTIYSEEVSKNTGPEYYAILDWDTYTLKKLMVDIEEEHKLGRIFDVDVFDKEHNQVSRSQMGLEGRKCLICNENARICMKNGTHSYGELINRIQEMAGYLGE